MRERVEHRLAHGFDATRKLPGENYHRAEPELVKMTDDAQALVDALQKKTG